jgi:hypothetical protein
MRTPPRFEGGVLIDQRSVRCVQRESYKVGTHRQRIPQGRSYFKEPDLTEQQAFSALRSIFIHVRPSRCDPGTLIGFRPDCQPRSLPHPGEMSPGQRIELIADLKAEFLGD